LLSQSLVLPHCAHEWLLQIGVIPPQSPSLVQLPL
jgi:hypothetical protein